MGPGLEIPEPCYTESNSSIGGSQLILIGYVLYIDIYYIKDYIHISDIPYDENPSWPGLSRPIITFVPIPIHGTNWYIYIPTWKKTSKINQIHGRQIYANIPFVPMGLVWGIDKPRCWDFSTHEVFPPQLLPYSSPPQVPTWLLVGSSRSPTGCFTTNEKILPKKRTAEFFHLKILVLGRFFVFGWDGTYFQGLAVSLREVINPIYKRWMAIWKGGPTTRSLGDGNDHHGYKPLNLTGMIQVER